MFAREICIHWKVMLIFSVF